MDRPGSEAVGIGAETDVKKILSYLLALETDFGGVTCYAPRCYDNSRDDSGGAVHFYVHPRNPVTSSGMDVKDRSSPVDSTWKKWHP